MLLLELGRRAHVLLNKSCRISSILECINAWRNRATKHHISGGALSTAKVIRTLTFRLQDICPDQGTVRSPYHCSLRATAHEQ